MEPGGADKEVKKSNVNEYLDKVADYYIRKRYDNLIESFLKGFNEVFDFEVKICLMLVDEEMVQASRNKHIYMWNQDY